MYFGKRIVYITRIHTSSYVRIYGNPFGPRSDRAGKVKKDFLAGSRTGGRGLFEDGNQWDLGRTSSSGRLGRGHSRRHIGWL